MTRYVERAESIRGLRIAYKQAGQGPPLILLHGFIADSRVWRRQIEELSSDFDVIAWDCPGCGGSSDVPEKYSMAEFADCLEGLLNALSVPAAHFVGLSWGGTLALEFYRHHSDAVLSLVLADTYAGWTGSLGGEEAAARLARCLAESRLPASEWVPQWVPHAFSESAPRPMLEEYGAIMSRFHPVGFRAMSHAVAPDFRDVLPSINVPTLLIWGDDDKRSPLSAAEMMRDGIDGARLVLIPNAGHVSNFEQPGRFNAEVREFCLAVEASR